MKEEKITFTEIAARLEKAIHADVGTDGLKILLYGWRRKRGMHPAVIAERAKENHGEPYLYDYELRSFSRYAGYDLTA